MNKKTIFALDRLRHNMLSKPIQQIRQILLKYYDPGTVITITKDYWNVEEPKEE